MFNVGDRVYSEAFGEGIVDGISTDTMYPISVRFNATQKTATFTQYGTFSLLSAEQDSPKNIKLLKEITTSPPTHSVETVKGVGTLVTFANGVMIYQSNSGIPIQVTTDNSI